MYDIDLKVIKKGYGFWNLFIFIASIFVIIPAAVIIIDAINYSKIDSEAPSIKSEIWEDEDDEGYEYYGVTYTFEYKNLQFECDSTKDYDYRPLGNLQATIIFASSDPEICRVKGEESSLSDLSFLLIWFLFPGIFFVLAGVNISKIKKRVKKVKKLNEVGKLVKGVPYTMKETGMSVNEEEILKPVAKYYTPNGTLLELDGDPRFDHKYEDYDGLVDIVIDESDPTLYFIDFEINRIGGNLQSDFYVNPYPEQVIKKDPYETNYDTYQDPTKDYYK